MTNEFILNYYLNEKAEKGFLSQADLDYPDYLNDKLNSYHLGVEKDVLKKKNCQCIF